MIPHSYNRGMMLLKNTRYPATSLILDLPSINFTKLYHSIHARGERVEDVIGDAEAEEEKGENVHVEMHEPAAPLDNVIQDEELEDGEMEDHEEVLIPEDIPAPQVCLPEHIILAVF